jgi:glycosyltransferase involved in cell wall biosynthesis
MKLSIIIVSYNTREYLAQCLQSIYDTVQNIAFEVIVVDNASTDGSVVLVQNYYPQVNLLTRDTNTGFGRANNYGFSVSSGDYVIRTPLCCPALPPHCWIFWKSTLRRARLDLLSICTMGSFKLESAATCPPCALCLMKVFFSAHYFPAWPCFPDCIGKALRRR